MCDLNDYRSDGWCDNLGEMIEALEYDHMLEVQFRFREGLRVGRPIASLQREFGLSKGQVDLILSRLRRREGPPRPE